MKVRDGTALWNDLCLYKLEKKPVGSMDARELELLAELLSRHCEGNEPPRFENGRLVIPFAAPLECRWWQRAMAPAEKRRLLLRIGVPEERLPEWMGGRELAMARGECDAQGRKTDVRK